MPKKNNSAAPQSYYLAALRSAPKAGAVLAAGRETPARRQLSRLGEERVESLAVESVAVIAVTAGGNRFSFPRPAHPAEPRRRQHLGVEPRHLSPAGVVEASRDALVHQQRLATALPHCVEAGDKPSKALAIMGVGVAAEHVHERGVEFDIVAQGGANSNRLLGTQGAGFCRNRTEPGEFAFVYLRIQVHGLGFVAEVPNEHPIVVGQRGDDART